MTSQVREVVMANFIHSHLNILASFIESARTKSNNCEQILNKLLAADFVINIKR